MSLNRLIAKPATFISYKAKPLTYNRILEGPIGKTLTAMTLPMVFGILAIVAFNLTDTYFVALLGTEALAAMGFIFPIVLIIGSFTTGLGSGVSAVISQAIGKGDSDDVQRLTKHSLILGLLLVGTLVTIGIATIDPLFRALGAGEETMPLIRNYMQYWYPGMLFLIVPMIGNSAIRATGDTKIPSYIMINAAVINVILDPLLIFGLGPFPEMGIAGAALATIVARCTSLLASLYVLRYKKKILEFHGPHFSHIGNSWKRIIYIGLPSAATQLLVPVGMAIFMRFVAEFGNEAMAAVGAAVRIEAFALVPLMALGTTLMPFIGQNWGAQKYQRVLEGVKQGGVFALFWGMLCVAVFFLSADSIAAIFSEEAEVIAKLVVYLNIVVFGYGFQGISMLVGVGLNAINKPLHSTSLTIIKMMVLFLPLGWAGAHLYGYEGLLFGILAGNIIAGIVAWLWQRSLLNKMTNVAAGYL